jgi:hypothetical protein
MTQAYISTKLHLSSENKLPDLLRSSLQRQAASYDPTIRFEADRSEQTRSIIGVWNFTSARLNTLNIATPIV